MYEFMWDIRPGISREDHTYPPLKFIVDVTLCVGERINRLLIPKNQHLPIYFIFSHQSHVPYNSPVTSWERRVAITQHLLYLLSGGW